MKKPKDEGKVVKLKSPEDMKHLPINPYSGSRSEDFSKILSQQVVQALWLAHSDLETTDYQIIASLNALMGIKPQDEIEGMLAAQMVAAHNASMECFRRAMNKEQSFEGRTMNLNQANKLSRTYATMVEALNRHRGKGEQKILVQHVNVEDGGQAIVGNVIRPEGGGAAIESEEQPYAKQITHAPMQEMPSPYKEGQPVPIPRDE